MFKLTDLRYDYTALAPTISETTLRTHHGKHHARYVQVTNELVGETGAGASLEEVVTKAETDCAAKLFNNAAQAWNHGFFWECMAPEATTPSGALAERIVSDFGDLAGLKTAFITEGVNHFGSGWVWLIARGGKLSVMSTHDAATPISAQGVTALLVCDLWEHAYYLDHKNDRAGYLTAWWDRLANWAFASSLYAAALEGGAGWRYPSPKAS